jgi:hypothetical protein
MLNKIQKYEIICLNKIFFIIFVLINIQDMKNTILFILFFSIGSSFSQIYISPNNYIYVADNFIFSKNETNLQSNSNIFLRNESQFLQGTTSTSTNTGTGKLSIFQEGSTNAYQYNYWCAPVGNATATIGNQAFGISMLNRPTGLTASTAAITTYHPDYNGLSNPLEIEPYWIYKYQINTGNTNEDWIFSGNTTTINAGEGFTMKGTNGTDNTIILGVQNNSGANLPFSGGNQRYDFRGKPNDGNININVVAAKLTLTGNPYPSAIDLTAFLTDATNSTGIAYFWESDKAVNSHFSADYIGGYGIFSPVSRGGTGIYAPATFYGYDANGNQLANVGNGSIYQRRFCPVAQGFMIEGNSTGTVQMQNSYRVFTKEGLANFSQFERHSNINTATNSNDFLPNIPSVSGFDYTTVSTLPVPQIRFKTVIDHQLINQTVLAFDNNATDNPDFGMDAKSGNDLSAPEFYFVVNNEPYTINIIDFDRYKKIPIGLKSTQPTNYNISISEILNFDEANNIYIHDKENDSYFNIKNVPFEINMPAGDHKTKFEITFIDKKTISNLITDFDIFQNNTTQILYIGNPKEFNLEAVNLYDITGKLVLDTKDLGIKTSYKIPTSNFSEGIYILKTYFNNGRMETKKIEIFKTK